MSSQGQSPTSKRREPDPEPVADRASADVGIVCSHKAELKPFLKRLDRQRKYADQRLLVRGGFIGETLRVAIVEAGPDFAAHRKAAELLITEHRTPWVLSCGFSSSLAADVKAGDLCLSNEVTDTHGNLLPVKCSITARKRVHVGRLIVPDHRPVDADAKLQLATANPGLAADTGSLAIVQVCQERNVRCLAIRAVVDDFDETIPATAAAMIFDPDSRAIGSALGSLVTGIRNWSELSQWKTRAGKAAENLDQFLIGIVEQIGEKVRR